MGKGMISTKPAGNPRLLITGIYRGEGVAIELREKQYRGRPINHSRRNKVAAIVASIGGGPISDQGLQNGNTVGASVFCVHRPGRGSWHGNGRKGGEKSAIIEVRRRSQGAEEPEIGSHDLPAHSVRRERGWGNAGEPGHPAINIPLGTLCYG